VARLVRQVGDRQSEEVALVSSAGPEALNASAWLKLNRAGWGIESGLHQRLDISFNEDRCRIQSRTGLWMLCMFRRLANSLYMEWCLARPKPQNVTTTHFQTLMSANLRHRALRLLLTCRPNLKHLS
jgi:hypothetical protein